MKFWEKLQILHDNPNHWNENGLTEIGIRYSNEIKRWIEEESER